MSSQGSQMSIGDIEALAESKLRDYDMESIPVNPVAIADLEGIDIYDANFQNPEISGLIHKEKDRVVIYVKCSDIMSRKRFTVAHELGHLFLHLGGQPEGNRVDIIKYRVDGGSQDDPDEEVEANQFAAALLMPRTHVATEWKLSRSIEEMAMKFGVSISAMSIRLKHLGLHHG